MAPAAKEKVLLTGGIGAGKSTVGRMLANRGADVVSADRIGHRLLEPGNAAHEAVRIRWPGVADASGTIDRARLAAIVFADPDALAELEAITHPAIRAAAAARVASSGAEVVVVEVPLRRDFLGAGWLRVVVHAAAPIRLQRTVDRGMSPADAAARLAAQPGDSEWLAWADYVVDNGGNRDALEAAVARFWHWLMEGRWTNRERPG